MSYVYIRFKDGSAISYNMKEFKLSEDYLKIHVAPHTEITISRNSIESFDAVLGGQNED